MLKLLIKRLALAAITIAIVVTMVFLAVEALPGDACTSFLGRAAKGNRLLLCQEEFGLNRPALERFVEWIGAALQGDLGQSMARRDTVAELVGIRLRNTLLLGLSACAIGVPLAIMLGVVAGLWRDRPLDIGLSTFAIIIMTIPEFVMGTVLILVFSIWLQWLPGIVITRPTAPLGEFLGEIILPVIALAGIMTAHIMRMVRTSVIDVMNSEYIKMAKLKGVPYWRMIRRHVLPNALVPTINLIALTIAWMLGGVVVIEVVFNYPGIGRLIVDAIGDRDLPLVQGIALVMASIYVLLNLAADILTLMLNPKLRTMKGH